MCSIKYLWGVLMYLKLSNLDLSGNTTEFKTFKATEFGINVKMFVLLKYSTALIRITLHGSVLSTCSFY